MTLENLCIDCWMKRFNFWITSIERQSRGVTINTANTYLNYAKSVFTILLNEEIVEENIFNNKNNIKEKEKKIDTLSVQY